MLTIVSTKYKQDPNKRPMNKGQLRISPSQWGSETWISRDLKKSDFQKVGTRYKTKKSLPNL